MFSCFPPAVYKCIIPVKKPLTTPSAIYHSLFRRRAKKLPYPAWPEIDDPYQPCCLPTLLRAMYSLSRDIEALSEKVIALAEKYISRQETIEPEIREQALACIKSHQTIPHHLLNIVKEPPLIFGISHTATNETMWRTAKVAEVVMQGLIYGNCENFYGDEDAYAHAHELGHWLANGFHAGVVLDNLSKIMNATLCALTAESLSADMITMLWERFWETNTYMSHLVKKFEPLEEIYATYISLRLSPVEVRNKVKARIQKALRKRKWEKAYKAFAEACDGNNQPQLAAFLFFEPACRMLEQLDMDGAKLLEKLLEAKDALWAFYAFNMEGIIDPECPIYDYVESLNADELQAMNNEYAYLVKKSGIPGKVFISVCETMRDTAYPNFMRLQEAAWKNDFSAVQDIAQPSSAEIMLVGSYPKPGMSYFIMEGKREDADIKSDPIFPDIPLLRIFFDSLRQQLSKRCGLVCALANSESCCGSKEELHRIYKRLPEKYKKYFKEPDCGLD